LPDQHGRPRGVVGLGADEGDVDRLLLAELLRIGEMERAHRHGEFRDLLGVGHAEPVAAHSLHMFWPGIEKNHFLARLHHMRAGIAADGAGSDDRDLLAHTSLPVSLGLAAQVGINGDRCKDAPRLDGMSMRRCYVMRWIRFERNGGESYGIVDGDAVQPVNGSPFWRWEKAGARVRLAEVKLLPPVVPRTFYACGLNYVGHLKGASTATGTAFKVPTAPDIGYRANNALIAHGEPIVIPRDAGEKVQYEGELVAVIGTQAKHLTEANALSCVFGYTIGNDVSERTWQGNDRTLWRAKNTDTFKPMGPWIETEVDLEKLVTIVRVNGREMIRFPTNHMLFGIATYLAAMSRYLTLYPGDVVWMGTDGDPSNIKHGDVVEVEISGIGVLRNPVADEKVG
jgi:2-keto-4-pentenoate hydratase/2-oxohepta-3-ene-1,7-dioic acid hydratase in catechol pathway